MALLLMCNTLKYLHKEMDEGLINLYFQTSNCRPLFLLRTFLHRRLWWIATKHCKLFV